MPYITPQELIDFTPIDAIKNRSTTLLTYDILEATAEIDQICGHDFNDTTVYPSIPDAVKLAALKLSQYFSIVNSDESVIKAIKSQNIGDFSFSSDGVEKPSVMHLLRPYITSTPKTGNVRMRLSSL